MVGQMQRSEHILQYDLVLLFIPKQNWGPLVSTSEKKWLQMGLKPTSSQNNFWAYLFMYRNSLYFFYHFYRPSGVHWQLISWIVYQMIAWESSEMIYWTKKKLKKIKKTLVKNVNALLCPWCLILISFSSSTLFIRLSPYPS